MRGRIASASGTRGSSSSSRPSAPSPGPCTSRSRAPDRAACDAFHAAALAAGGGDNGAPGPRPRVPRLVLRRVRARSGRQQRGGGLSPAARPGGRVAAALPSERARAEGRRREGRGRRADPQGGERLDARRSDHVFALEGEPPSRACAENPVSRPSRRGTLRAPSSKAAVSSRNGAWPDPASSMSRPSVRARPPSGRRRRARRRRACRGRRGQWHAERLDAGRASAATTPANEPTAAHVGTSSRSSEEPVAGRLADVGVERVTGDLAERLLAAGADRVDEGVGVRLGAAVREARAGEDRGRRPDHRDAADARRSCGRRSAAIAPPIDQPTRTGHSSPRRSSSRATSSTCVVVRVGVVRLRRAPVATQVDRDAAVRGGEAGQLSIPDGACHAPAVEEDDGVAGADVDQRGGRGPPPDADCIGR